MRLRIIALMACVAGPAQAGEFRAGLGGWHYGMEGTVVDGGDALDFEDDLALRGQGRRSVMLGWKFAAGAWPDVTLTHGQIGARGLHEQSSTTQFGPIGLTGSSVLATDADFDDTDLVLAWGWSAAGFDGALGAAAKWLKGDVLITDTSDGEQVRQPYDVVFPELHVQARRRFGGWSALAVTAQAVEYSGDRAVEWRAAFEVDLFRPLWLELAWQEKRYEIGVADYALDADLDGLLVRFGVVIPNL